MSTQREVYLDYAATSAIRPDTVAAAVASYLRTTGATPGRGGHRLGIEAGRVALRCRQALARLLNIPGDPGRIAFMFNATHALNTAIWGLLEAGDAVVVTAFDHNAVLRPTHKIARERGVEVRLVPGQRDGSLDEDALTRALDGARLLMVNLASNVLGTAADAAGMIARAHAAGVLTLVDSAQAAGHIPTSVADLNADLVAITGHKGLLGPQGVGALWVRPGLDVEPLLTGGTGGDSLVRDMPPAMPDHLEAGTQNAPAMAGLIAGIEWIERRGVPLMHERSSALKRALHEGLADVPGIEVLSPLALDGAAIVTVRADRVDPGSLARELDTGYGVLVRPGLHCAPESHRLLGSEKTGALRFSLGWASDAEDVEQAIDAVASIVGKGRVVPVPDGVRGVATERVDAQ